MSQYGIAVEVQIPGRDVQVVETWKRSRLHQTVINHFNVVSHGSQRWKIDSLQLRIIGRSKQPPNYFQLRGCEGHQTQQIIDCDTHLDLQKDRKICVGQLKVTIVY
jgi:hypothetical protein